MRKGQKHTEETRKKISENTRKAMQRPEVREKLLKRGFQKGHIPWNKGLKGIHLNPKNEFKKGQFAGEKHPCWKGGVWKPKNDCIHLYDGKERKRRPRVVYEEHYGPIPKGYVIYHIDGNRYNDDPTNLIAISRAELIKLNRMNRKKEKAEKKGSR